MLDIAFIRQNVDAVRAAITNKRCDVDLDALLAADKERRDAITARRAEARPEERIAALIPKASKDDRPKLIEEGKTVKTELEELSPPRAKQIEIASNDLMPRIPSILRPEVPVGKGEETTSRIRKVGDKPTFSSPPMITCGS